MLLTCFKKTMQQAVDPPSFDMSLAFRESANNVPLIFILSNGWDNSCQVILGDNNTPYSMNNTPFFYICPMFFVGFRRNFVGFPIDLYRKSYDITPKTVEKRYTIHRVGCRCLPGGTRTFSHAFQEGVWHVFVEVA